MGATPDHQDVAAALPLLRHWQAQRLARTYADLVADPRYAPATAFFLSDVYGERDFTERDRTIQRVMPLIRKTLPEASLAPIEQAMELHELTTALDATLCEVLVGEVGMTDSLTEAAYAEGYRRCRNRQQRERQIELLLAVGKHLDRVVAKPMLRHMLYLARRPARLAGFGDVQEFLERGFKSFKHMGGAAEFIRTIESREQTILDRLFAGHPRPFDP